MGFSIDKKAKKVVFVVNPPKDLQTFPPDFYPSLVSWCLENCDIYAYVLHDLDFTDDGEPKRHHIHLYCEFKSCKRVLTHLNALADWLGFDTCQISAQVASNNPAGFFQYLIHRNNPEKHQYDPKDIISNLDAGEVKALLEADSGNCSIERFVSVCATAKCFADVLRDLGLETYTKYHRAIDNLYRDLHRFGR